MFTYELHSVRGLRRDVLYLGWPIAPFYVSPNAGGGELRDLSQWVQLYTRSPNKLWRSISIFDLCIQCLSKIVLGIIVLTTSLPQKDSNAQLQSLLAMVYSPTAKCSLKNLVISAHCRFWFIFKHLLKTALNIFWQKCLVVFTKLAQIMFCGICAAWHSLLRCFGVAFGSRRSPRIKNVKLSYCF